MESYQLSKKPYVNLPTEFNSKWFNIVAFWTHQKIFRTKDMNPLTLHMLCTEKKCFFYNFKCPRLLWLWLLLFIWNEKKNRQNVNKTIVVDSFQSTITYTVCACRIVLFIWWPLYIYMNMYSWMWSIDWSALKFWLIEFFNCLLSCLRSIDLIILQFAYAQWILTKITENSLKFARTFLKRKKRDFKTSTKNTSIEIVLDHY